MFLPLLMSVALVGHWAAAEEVGILSGISGYSQIVTSSTLQWVTSDNGHVPENAVVGATIEADDEDDDVKGTVWVCRARAAGMWVAGRLTAADKSKSAKCTVSMHGEVSSHSSYQVLQNVEDGGKLSWERWDKYNAVDGGTVAGGKAPYLTYVARRKTTSGNMSHYLGKVDTTRGLLGKIIVVEADGQEKEYEDGEVLVETEPVRYEMHDVKFNTYRARYSRDRMTLGAANLRNEDVPEDDGTGGEVNRVDTVIAYHYNLTVGWGHGHAILTGLPVKVRLANGTTMDEFKWASDAITKGESTYQVETFLAPGRGVNVTLVGNWTESNIPYTAVVTAIYADNTKKSRSLVGMRRELGLRDVRPDFGPVYYLHNYTHVPTTTTTTTSTTTQKTTTAINTTKKTTTSTEEPKPIPASPMEEQLHEKKKGAPAEVNAKGENQSMMSDGPGTERGQNSGTATLRIGPAILVLVAVIAARVFST